MDFNCDGDTADSGSRGEHQRRHAAQRRQDPDALQPVPPDWGGVIFDGGTIGGVAPGEATTDVDEATVEELAARPTCSCRRPVRRRRPRRTRRPGRRCWRARPAVPAKRSTSPSSTGRPPPTAGDRLRARRRGHRHGLGEHARARPGAGTTYHYRLVVRSDTHLVRGTDRTFTTPAGTAEPALPEQPDPSFGVKGWTRVARRRTRASSPRSARARGCPTGACSPSAPATSARPGAGVALDDQPPAARRPQGPGLRRRRRPRARLRRQRRATDIELLPDGRFVVVGTGSEFRGGLEPAAIVVARFHPDGAPDDSFGTGGRVVMTVPGETCPQPAGIDRRADGRLIVSASGPRTAAAARDALAVNGARDTTYGDAGLASLPIGANGTIADARLQPDGALVAAGSGAAPDGSSTFAVMRLTPAGRPTPASASRASLAPGGGASDRARARGRRAHPRRGQQRRPAVRHRPLHDRRAPRHDVRHRRLAEPAWSGQRSPPRSSWCCRRRPARGRRQRSVRHDARAPRGLRRGRPRVRRRRPGEPHRGRHVRRVRLQRRVLHRLGGAADRLALARRARAAFGAMRFGGPGIFLSGTVARFGLPPESTGPDDPPRTSRRSRACTSPTSTRGETRRSRSRPRARPTRRDGSRATSTRSTGTARSRSARTRARARSTR